MSQRAVASPSAQSLCTLCGSRKGSKHTPKVNSKPRTVELGLNASTGRICRLRSLQLQTTLILGCNTAKDRPPMDSNVSWLTFSILQQGAGHVLAVDGSASMADVARQVNAVRQKLL